MKSKRAWYIKMAPVRPPSDLDPISGYLFDALLSDLFGVTEEPKIHIERDGLTACGASSVGAFVTDHENKATCPYCCVLSPFFSEIPKGRN